MQKITTMLFFDWVQWIAAWPLYAYVSVYERYVNRSPDGSIPIDVRKIRHKSNEYLTLVHFDPVWQMYSGYYLDDNAEIRLITLQNAKDPACGEAIFANVEPMSETVKLLSTVLYSEELDHRHWDEEQLALIDGMRGWMNRYKIKN